MCLTTLLTVLLSIVFICAVFYRRRKSKYLKNVPGPKPNIIFGNLLDFLEGTEKMLEILLEYADTFSSPFIIRDGTFSRIVVITDTKWAEFILSSTKFIDKASQYNYFVNWLGTGLLTSTGSKWKKRRRMLTPSFHFSILESFVEIFHSVGDVFINKLQNKVGRGPFNIAPLISLCTLDVICEASMGVSVDAQGNDESEYVKSVKEMCSLILDRSLSPLHAFIYPLTLNYYKEKRLLKILHRHTDRVIENRIKHPRITKLEIGEENLGTKKKLAFLDLLLEAEIDGKPLSRLDIREEVDTFMFEGHDTTSSAINFALYFLSINPDIQKKAVAEQISIFGNIKGAKNVKATYDDLTKMKYLEMVIKETLRMCPSVPMITRKAHEDFEKEGIIFPKGQCFMIFIFALQRNPKYYSDPDRFIPERWKNMQIDNPYMYVPFSAGPRNCIGQKFAMLEMKSLLSKILRNFEIHPLNPKQELILAPEIILVSKNGVHVSLENRN